jgi:soluble lytic murein transglycosylase-like protein
MGLAQVMPATFRDISRASGISGDPFNPETNLNAGAWYMARQRAIFKAPRPEAERHNLACAAYNSGAGNIIKAQRIAGNPEGWQPVAEALPQVTGRHSTETISYVKRIRETYRRYILTGL